MKTVKVVCDGCGADITTRTNSVDYRLVLSAESESGYGPGFYTDMMKYPAVDRAHHFCFLPCLDIWSDRRRHVSMAWGKFHDAWVAERGTHHNGRVVSYPSVSNDLRLTKIAEFEAEALAALPKKFGETPL